MKVIVENVKLEDFEAWSGARHTQSVIMDNDKENEFDSLIDELYPDGLTDTQLNDILWHDSEWVCQTLGIEAE